MKIRNAAIIGLGAIGAVYGNLLHKAYGCHFTAIAGGARAERLKSGGVCVNGEAFFPQVRQPGEKFTADLILICVKNYQLEEAIEDIRGFVGPETVLLPLLNGVTARERLKKAFPENRIFYGLAIYIDAVREKGGVVHTKNGLIQFGDADNSVVSPEADAVLDYLTKAGIQAEICPDMVRAVWKKWMLNVGVNQVSAVTRSPYGKIATVPSTLALFHEAMMEIIALAQASGIDLGEKDALEFEGAMSHFSPDGKTSMLQDVEAGRCTEVDYFAGTAEEMGKRLKIPTPVNHVLLLLLHSIEAMY